MSRTKKWIVPVAILAGLFGLATLYSGGMALFGGPAARQAVGDAVPVVLWFNFLAGSFYIVAAIALFLRHPAARPLAWAIGLASLAVFAVLIALALSGTPFEWRTIGAMVLRSGFWLAIALALRPGSDERTAS